MKYRQKGTQTKKKIADEILHQIGGSVIFVLLIIAAVAICMVGWLSITSKKTELIQESKLRTSWQDFFSSIPKV